MTNLKNILLNKNCCKSIWFMRQAGRYLPEFRKIRKKNKNFIKLCLNSELSSIITLQPIKRFNVDSAIIFSDILMVPYALGQKITFIQEKGPKLSEFSPKIFLKNNKKEFLKKLNPIYKAIDSTRKKLDKKKSLISFIGAPWTLLIYMLNIKNNKNEINSEIIFNRKLDIKQIIDELIKFLCIHIDKQIEAGADVIQIFDSWAGLLPKDTVKQYCYQPNKKIIDFCRKKNIPTICFPKGINERYEDFNNLVRPDGINIDYQIDPLWAKEKLKNVVIQGGMDPKLLLKSEDEMLEGASKYIQAFKDIPYVFNLGHGLLPETDPVMLEKLINFYRNN